MYNGDLGTKVGKHHHCKRRRSEAFDFDDSNSLQH